VHFRFSRQHLVIAVSGKSEGMKVGSTPTGVPFTFLDTKSNQIQGVMVDIITEIRAASEASADSIRGLRTVGSIPRERRGVAPHQCRGANDLRLLL
jgi:hypothetical protein